MSNDTKNVLANNTQTSEKTIRLRFVIILYIVLSAVNFLFANYIKHLDVYNDEYFYLNTAQNIFRGEGPVIDGLGKGFDKILYSFILAPLYFIKDAVFRVKMISLVNCLLVSSSLFPIWLIARKVELSRTNTFLALVLTCVFPELSISMSFMSESLFFPLALFFIYFWIVNEQSPTKKNAVILGIMGFLCYFCKASFLAVFVACVGFQIVYQMISYLMRDRSNPVKLKSFYSKSRFINLIIFCGVFIVLNAALKLTLFKGSASSYQIKSISMFFESYRFWYAVYGFVYNIAGIMISILIFPLVYPVLQYKKLGETAQKLFCFMTITILATVAVVDYTITSYEDYGMSVPRVHMRYYSYCILIILLVFLKSVETSYAPQNEKRPKYWAALCLVSVVPCMIYRGTSMGVPDQTLLSFYEDYKANIDALELEIPKWLNFMRSKGYIWFENSDPMKIDIFAFLFGAAMLVLILLFHWLFTKKYEKYAKAFALSAIFLVMSTSSLDARSQWRSRNNDHNNLVREVVSINNYLASNTEGFNMLYITGDDFSKYTKTVNTYLNLEKGRKIVFAEAGAIDINALSQNNYLIEKTEFTNLYSFDRITYSKYEPISDFDYILTDSDANLGCNRLSGVEEISGLETKAYTLYKNLDPKTLIIEPDNDMVYLGGEKTIWLGSNYLSADYTVTDNGITNVNDVCINLNIPVDEKIRSLNVRVELKNELDTYQLCMIRQRGNDDLNYVVRDEAAFCFEVDVKDKTASFEILLPNVAIESLGQSGAALIQASSCHIEKIIISNVDFSD